MGKEREREIERQRDRVPELSELETDAESP